MKADTGPSVSATKMKKTAPDWTDEEIAKLIECVSKYSSILHNRAEKLHVEDTETRSLKGVGQQSLV